MTSLQAMDTGELLDHLLEVADGEPPQIGGRAIVIASVALAQTVGELVEVMRDTRDILDFMKAQLQRIADAQAVLAAAEKARLLIDTDIQL